jgi:hypothetical protein
MKRSTVNGIEGDVEHNIKFGSVARVAVEDSQ